MKVFTTLFFLVALACDASAATIVQTKAFSFVPNNFKTFTFDKFDPAAGTLSSVLVEVSYTKSGGRLEVDNDSDSSGTINLSHTIVAQLTTSGVSLRKNISGVHYVGDASALTHTDSLLAQNIGVTTGDATNAFNATYGADYVSFYPGTNLVSDSGTIRTADQTDYVKDIIASTFDLTFTGTQSVNATGLGGLQQSFTVSNVSGGITVTYNYTPVPEVSSVLLGGLGLLALARRRR